MIVSIQELRKDLLNRFNKTNGSEFGVTKIDFPLKLEGLIINLEHYSAPDITYRISFPKILSYVVLQEYLQENSREGVIFLDNFSSPILNQLEGTKYLEYLHNCTDLKIFFEDEALKRIKQYAVYTQNVMIDIVTDQIPIIEIIEEN
jgi:hypothetical protein